MINKSLFDLFKIAVQETAKETKKFIEEFKENNEKDYKYIILLLVLNILKTSTIN
jgi:hypothetical protein